MENNEEQNVIEETTEEVSTNIEVKKEKKKLDKKDKIIIVLSVVIVLIVGIVFFFVFINNEEEEFEDDTPVVNNDNNISDEDKKYNLPVYAYQGEGILYTKKPDSNGVVIAMIQTESENAKILNVTGTAKGGYVLYLDNQVKLYSVKDKTTTVLDKIDTSYTNYDFISRYTEEGFSDYTLDKIYGISYSMIIDNKMSDDCKYYDLNDNTHKYSGYCIESIMKDKDYFIASNKFEYDNSGTINGSITYLLDFKGDVKLSHRSNGYCYGYSVEDSYMVFSSGCTSDWTYDYYLLNGNAIVESINYKMVNSYNNTLYYYKDNQLVKYNGSFNYNNDFKDYKILMVSRNYAVGIYDNKLYMINIDDSSKYEVSDWKDEYVFHSPISRYLTKDDLKESNNNEEGYYLIFAYDSELNSKAKEVYFNPVTKETKSWELEEVPGYGKPVLYLYPTETTDVRVTFEHPNNLTTTYPKYKDEWKVTAHPNGDLYDNNGRYYYGLYWEEDLNHYVDFNEGFYVEKDNAIDFLEEKLSIIGLNDRERNEFIMYWLPILEKNGKNLVYFELTQERDSYNKLIIEPKVDSILRVAIHVKKVNKKVNIKEERLTSFNRVGFSAVEWGGINY